MTENTRALIILILVASLFFFRVPEAALPELEPIVSASTTAPTPEVKGVSTAAPSLNPTPHVVSEPIAPAPTLPAPVTTPSPSPSYNPPPSTPAPSGGGSSAPQPTPQPTPTPIPTPSPTHTAKMSIVAWMHAQDWSKAVESVKKNSLQIGEVAPAWYLANADGTISPRESVDDSSLIQTARANGMLLRPLIMSVSGAGASPRELVTLLKNEDLRKKQIDILVQLAIEKGYDGFDVDFESLEPKNLSDLAIYVEELSAALHAQGKTLAVSLETHPNESVLPAWKRIGVAADNVRLMAYGKKSATPAPITDLSWMKNRVAHILKVIPKEKLTVGLPLYCLKWEGSTVRSNTWEKYKGVNGVVCENAESVKEKVEIAEDLGVTNIAFWRLGGEDPAIWSTF